MFNQYGGLALGSLGCGPSLCLDGFPLRLRREFGGTSCLLAELHFIRSLRGFALGGAGSSFYEQGFSCRPALGDCRILRPRRGAELFQQRLFRPRRVKQRFVWP